MRVWESCSLSAASVYIREEESLEQGRSPAPGRLARPRSGPNRGRRRRRGGGGVGITAERTSRGPGPSSASS